MADNGGMEFTEKDPALKELYEQPFDLSSVDISCGPSQEEIDAWQLHAGEPPEDGWRASEKRRREEANAHRDDFDPDYAIAIAPWRPKRDDDDSSRDNLD